MDKQADLRKWFKEKWVDISRKKKGGGHPECGRDDADSGGGYPKCRPAKAAARMTKKQKAYAVRSKRSKPQGVGGKPTMVATFKKKAMFDPEHFEDTLEMLHSKEAFFKAIRAATKGTLAGAGGRRGYRKVVEARRFADANRARITAAAEASRKSRRAARASALPARYGPFQPGQGGFAPVRTRRRRLLDARVARAQRNRPDAASARAVSGGRSAAKPAAPATPKSSTGQGTQGTFSFASPAAPTSKPSTPSAPKTGLDKGISVAKGVGKDALNYARANPLKTGAGIALAAGAANAMRTPKINPQTGQPQTTRTGQALRGAAVGAGLAGAAYGGAKLFKKVATLNPLSNSMNSNLRNMASSETAHILDRLEKEAGKKTKAAVLAAGAAGGAKAAGPAAAGLRTAADSAVAKTKSALTEDSIRGAAKGAREAMFEGSDKLRAAAKATGDSDVASGVKSLTRAANLEGTHRIGSAADKAIQHSGAAVDKVQSLGTAAKEIAENITPGTGALAGAGVAGAALAANKLRKMRKNRKLRKAVTRGEKARAKLEKQASAETAYILDRLEKEAGAGVKRNMLYNKAADFLYGPVPGAVGMLAAAATPTKSLKESIKNDAGKHIGGEAKSILPGVAAYRSAKRQGTIIRGPEVKKLYAQEEEKLKKQRAKEGQKKEGRYRQGTHEQIASANPLQLATLPLGMAAALATKTKSLRQIAAEDVRKDETRGSRTKAHLARHLIPGKASYDFYKRLGAGNHGPEAMKIKGEVDQENQKKVDEAKKAKLKAKSAKLKARMKKLT